MSLLLGWATTRRRSRRAPDPMRSAGPPVALVSRRIAGTIGLSEPTVYERRKTSGASLSEFSPDARPRSVRFAAVRILVPLPLASLADSGHDGIRTHGHRMSSRDADATRIEVRRSVRTELRALESLFYPDPKRRCGAGLPPERRLPGGRQTSTIGVSEPKVRERRTTSGASRSNSHSIL